MSRFDMPEHNFLPHNKLRGEQLNKVHSDKQEGNKAELEQKQEGRTEIVCDTFQQAVDASAQEVMAAINRGFLNIRESINSQSISSDARRKSDTSGMGLVLDKDKTFFDVGEAEEMHDTPNVGTNGTTTTDNPTETTISNEELYANREKYTQEFVDSLNIGLSAETFSGVIDTYFQKVTINGEEVYILRSGTLTQVKDLISQIYVADKLATTPDYSPKTITLDDILQHFGVTESDLQTLMQKLGATDLADFVTKLKNADINELTYQSSNEPISIESLMQDFGASRTEIEYLMSQFGATDIDDFISKLKALPMDVIEDMVSSHPEKYPKAGVEGIIDLVTYLRARSDVFFESNVQDIKNLLSYIRAPYAFDPLEANGGYALTSQQKFEERKANYYYMCYLNGISCTGHEFEDGTYNKEIARQCGLYGYENVFEDYLNNENVQQYLLENFGITVSTPLSEEYKELWDKLANLAAIGENGKNTGEYNVYNVLKYFGLALTDAQFMSFVGKASYEPEESSILDNSWDIEAVKATISERYPELLENFEDDFLEWIGSNAFEFLLYNQSKLRANGLQDFVNYGNIPSWITFNNGTEFNKELLLKCCIQSMAKLADIGNKLGYNPTKEFVNRELAEFVTEIYTTEVENLESTGATGGPRREQASQGVPDYVLNFMRQKYGANLTYALDSDADWAFYINDEYVGYMAHGSSMIYLSDTKTSNFVNIDYYKLKNGKVIPHTYFNANQFLGTYYSDMSSPLNEREYFINGETDFYEMLQHMDFDALCEVMSHLMDPELTGRGETNAKPEDELKFWADLRKEIYSNETLYSFLYDTISGKIQERGETFLQSLLPEKDTNSDISKLYYLISHRDSEGFGWNADEVLFNVPGAGQQNVGDCWYISFLEGMSQHPELVELLKNYCLHYDKENETYTVIIKGESYTFTKAEIMGETELSKDDTELRALEMAALKYYGINGNSIIMSGHWSTALTFFTGLNYDDIHDLCDYLYCTGYFDNDGKFINMFETYEKDIIDTIQSGNMSELGVYKDGYWAIDTETGEKVYLPGNHAYNIVSTDGEYLYIQNPWAGESNKVLRLSYQTVKNNSEDFDIELVDIAKFSRALQDANGIVPYALRDKLESGDYFTENGDFDMEQYYHDCEEWDISPFNLQFMFDRTSDGSKLSIFNPDGTCTIVFKPTSGQIQIIEIGLPYVSFETPDGVPFNIENFTDEELIDKLKKSEADISMFIMSDGTLDRDLLSQVLSKLTVNGWFDATPLMILQYYFRTGDYFDSEGFKDLLSNFNNYDELERFARSVLLFEKVKMALEQPQINPETIFAHMREFASLTMRRPNGSIYAGEMDYWQWADVLTNPLASTEDYIAAINAMNSIINAAKSIGVSLDAYIHMNPAERERRRGMLTTPMNDEILIEPWNIVPVDENDGEEGVGMYYSTPNQSSCYSAPEWFVEAYLNGEIPDDDEITWNVLNETCTEAEEKLFFERQHYRIWQMTNSSLLIGLPPTEAYGLYMMDMMYFSMWLNTDAIIEGYDQDTTWEDLYEAYSNSNFKLF